MLFLISREKRLIFFHDDPGGEMEYSTLKKRDAMYKKGFRYFVNRGCGKIACFKDRKDGQDYADKFSAQLYNLLKP